jgi:transcription antitermination factor NusG
MAKTRKRCERRYRPSAPLLPRRLPRPRVEIDRGLAWFVVWVSSARFQAERDVVRRLSERGIATYHPVEAVERMTRGKRTETERPALGRYVFVGLDAGRSDFGPVHDALEDAGGWFAGFYTLLGRVLKIYDHEREVAVALRVPASALQRLADGLVCFEAVRQPFLPGESVRAVSGALSGLRAEIEHADDVRVRALVHLFGGQVRVEFEPGQLEAAA